MKKNGIHCGKGLNTVEIEMEDRFAVLCPILIYN